MTDLDVKTKPDNIWNVDETSIALEHSPPKVIASRHYRPAVIAAGRGPNTTMFGCGSAKGQTIPPYIVFKGARITAEMREGLTQDPFKVVTLQVLRGIIYDTWSKWKDMI